MVHLLDWTVLVYPAGTNKLNTLTKNVFFVYTIISQPKNDVKCYHLSHDVVTLDVDRDVSGDKVD